MMHQKEIFLPYKIIEEPGEGEYEEKKSRFIAKIVPAASEEEAVAFIDLVKKKYYDARHHCPALIIGRNREVTRCSDDGEPGGTAGKPILEVMLGAEITNAVMVVTRYFGGTLLGTGGLVRAYTQAAKAALADAKTATMRYGTRITVEQTIPTWEGYSICWEAGGLSLPLPDIPIKWNLTSAFPLNRRRK